MAETYKNRAKRLGREAGEAAAMAWATENVLDASYRDYIEYAVRVLHGIKHDDETITEQMPWCDLSGEFADALTGQNVISNIKGTTDSGPLGRDGDMEYDVQLLDWYEEAYNNAVRKTVKKLLVDFLDI